MLISRRSMLSLSAAALAAPALIRPALAADCGLTLSKGISFTRQDGSRGLARMESDGGVVIDYVTNKGARIDRRGVTQGVFETWRVFADSEYPVVGSAPPEWRWSYSPKPVEPDAGLVWTGRVRESYDLVTYGAEMRESHNRSRQNWQATFTFLPQAEVRLSGCYYMTIPVEATFSNGSGQRSQRWVYFPQLWFGIETKRDGVANGIVAMTPV